MAESSDAAWHAWHDAFPITLLVSGARVAFNVRALVFSALAITLVAVGWHMLGWAFSDAQDDASPTRKVVSEYQRWPWQDPLAVYPTAQSFQPANLAQSTEDGNPVPGATIPILISPMGAPDWLQDNPLVVAWRHVQRPFWQMFQANTSLPQFVFLLLAGLWSLAVWAFFGGIITRLAAVALARGEQLPTPSLLAFAASKWRAYFSAPLFPLLCALVITAGLAVFGLLLRAQVTSALAGVFWFLALIGGLILAVLLIPLLFGWPLMWATISTEGTDSFDAFSRSYSYTYQRPLHYFLYAIVAALLGSLCWIVVAIFATAVIQLSLWAVGWGSGADALRTAWPFAPGFPSAELNPVGRFGSWFILIWVNVVWTLAVGFLFSYFWTAITAIYFLLRRRVDGAELDEVYVPEDEQPYGLPPLRTDASGVPQVADEAGKPE